ncbi:LysR family transcriptional regulator [Paraburkholderia caffeinilytica]|uniref:LysR family transcriptional regulator n=1 Tax=Paraburkholderia caffeinilytica TaxID=1761016 RepID=A0ABQ1LK12_9BURK|nr:LysR family transcriptional regulator [Paraburkholderia caffeinilytica]GGC24813.1 LysR family transcriptional regulator [Paraburkholderia caffeinilytica]CAB3776141.1 HTH-type transcriptional activator AllS [Paraburkholderia caffeinilytica]
MLDGVTLDQLRTFIAAVDEGSFSAAGRKLRRAQSVVSQTLANLEAQLEVKLFDRTARYPQLTDAGKSLLLDARSVADTIDSFKARARAMREGLEPELSVAMDVMYPMDSLTGAAAQSQKDYPHTPLRLYVEALGGVMKLVVDRICNIGVIGTLPIVTDELQVESLRELELVTVVSPAHPLANHRGLVSSAAIRKQVQLVLSDRTALSEGREFGVLSASTWRLADLGAKYAFLKAGLGWGHMPLHMVKDDLESGALMKIRIEGLPRDVVMPMKVVYRKDAPPGPAARAFIAQLEK